MTNFIYVLKDPTTNLVIYVGKTKNPEKRYKDHCRPPSGKFRSNLDKWKKDLLSKGKIPLFEIIKECSEEEVDKFEKFFISEYRKKFTILNMTEGGDGLQNPSDEVRRKIGLKSKGRVVSSKTRDKIAKMHYNSGKKIVCYDINGVLIGYYPNARRASEELNIGFKNISKTLNDKEHFIKNYTFFFDCDDDIQSKLKYRIENTHKKRRIFVRISDDEEKKEYDNINEAASECDVNFRNIWLCLNGYRKKCGGYRWSYVD